MDNNACLDFCCSAFANHIDPELTGRVPDLTNALLPIFRRTNFTSADGTIISRDDYDILRPSLQLASLFLQSDPMTIFLVKLFDGELRTGNGILIPRDDLMWDNPGGTPFQAWDVHVTLPEDQGKLNDQMRKRGVQILTKMADMVGFELGAEREEPGGIGGSSTITSEPLSANLRKFFPWGKKSVIWIDNPLGVIRDALDHASQENSKHHRDGCTPAKRVLHREYLANQRTCDACSWPLELVAARLFTTETVVHELAHSCRFAAWGTQHVNFEVPQTLIPAGETGFEVWMALIGGTPKVASDDGDTLRLESIPGVCNEGKSQPKWGGPVGYLARWPNQGLLKYYISSIGMDLRPLDLVPYIKDDLYIRVPLSYFESLFTQAFWDRVAVEGPEAMKPATVGSWYFKWKGGKIAWVPCDGAENMQNVLFVERLGQYELRNPGPSLPGRSELKRKRWNVAVSTSDSSVGGRNEKFDGGDRTA